MPFPPIPVLKKFLKAKAVEYLVLDENFTIKSMSSGVLNYSDYPDAFKLGNQVWEAFPEFIGFEEDFEKVRNKEAEIFQIKELAKAINPHRPEYINFYVISNHLQETIASGEQLLFIFFEDDSENTIVKQRLIQQVNELCLILELEDLSPYEK